MSMVTKYGKRQKQSAKAKQSDKDASAGDSGETLVTRKRGKKGDATRSY